MTQLQLIEEIQASYMSEATGHKTWQQHADTAVRRLARTGQPFTADTVRAMIPNDIRPAHSNAWGGLFSSWFHRGLIEPVGYTTGSRAVRHQGVQRLWRGIAEAQSIVNVKESA